MKRAEQKASKLLVGLIFSSLQDLNSSNTDCPLAYALNHWQFQVYMQPSRLMPVCDSAVKIATGPFAF